MGKKNLSGEEVTLVFASDAELVLSDWDDKEDKEIVSDASYKSGDEIDVDVLNDHGGKLDLQLASGSIAYRVPKALFKRLA